MRVSSEHLVRSLRPAEVLPSFSFSPPHPCTPCLPIDAYPRSELVRCTIMGDPESPEADPRAAALASVLVPRIMLLRPRFVADSQAEEGLGDEDVAKGLARLFAEVGEAYVSLIATGAPEVCCFPGSHHYRFRVVALGFQSACFNNACFSECTSHSFQRTTQSASSRSLARSLAHSFARRFWPRWRRSWTCAATQMTRWLPSRSSSGRGA